MADRMEIELPDGTVIDAPAGTTRAQIEAKFPQFAQKPSMLAEAGRVADKAIRGGALALPGLIGDAAVGIPNWLARKAGLVEDTPANTPGKDGFMMWPSDALQTLTGGELSKPQTATGKAIGNIGEAVVGTVAGGPGVSSIKGLAKAAPGLAAIGLGAGVGGEAVGQVIDNPLARLAGGLVGGGAVAVKQAYNPNNVDKVARTMFDGVDRREVEEALAKQAASSKAGLDLNLGQAMGRETNIDAVLAGLASSTEGKNATNLLRSQPGQIKVGMETAVQDLPGKVRATRDIANRSQEVATDLIETAKKARSDSWKSAFDDELARIQTGPIANIDQAVKLAAQRANELTAAKVADSAAKSARQKVIDAIEAAKSAPAPFPSAVGSSPSGILLSDAGRGEAALNKLATHEAQQAQLRGAGSIVDSAGNPINTAPSVPALPAAQTPAAEAALSSAQGQVSAAERSLEETTKVPSTALAGVYKRLTNLMGANGNPAIKKNLLNLRESLLTEDGYISDAGKLNELLKYAAHQTKPVNMQTSGLDAGASKYVNGIISSLRDDLGKAFSPIRAANERFAANTEVDALKKSSIGDLAGRAGAQTDLNAPKGKLLALLEAGTTPGATRSEILTTARQLNKSDPELFVDAGKTWISDKLQKALNTPDARDASDLATRVTKAFGSPSHGSNQTQGLADTLAGMAEAQGLPKGDLQALPKFLDFVSHAASRPSSTAGVTPADVAALEGASAVGRIGHVSKITLLRQPILAYTNRLQSNTRAEIDRLLTTPEGIRMLHELSKTSPYSAAGQKAISAFIAAGAEAQGDSLSPGINK